MWFQFLFPASGTEPTSPNMAWEPWKKPWGPAGSEKPGKISRTPPHPDTPSIFEGDQWPKPHGFPVFYFPPRCPLVYLHPRRLETSPRWVTSESWWECMVGCLTTWLMTTGFLPLNPGYKVDKMGLKKHQKRRWVIKKAMSGYVTTFGTTMLHQLMFFFLGKAMFWVAKSVSFRL